MSAASPATETPPAPRDGELEPGTPPRSGLRQPRPRFRWPRLPRPGAYRLLPFLPVALFAVLAWSRMWTSEDAFIYFRVVDQLLAGNGPVFNVGERVEAYTGPLWLGVLAVARAVAPAGVALEWMSVAIGLALSVGGLLAAVLAARRLWSPPPWTGAGSPGVLLLPLGALVVAALPAFWDYATSGLETSLVFAWLGGSFLGLVAVALPAGGEGTRSPRARYGLAVALGLGPLVRPDLTIFAAAFLVVLAVLERPVSPYRALRLLASAAAIPLVYQLFRMGYFGSLVPSTALAKEASATYWARGWSYLVNLFGPYALWLPVAALLGWAAVSARGLWRGSDRERALLVAVPIAAGVLQALYVVRLGGDYMHARMLLPGVFAVLMPVAVVAAKRRWATALLAAVIVPWAVVAAFALRAPVDEATATLKVTDQRLRYAELWGYREMVTLGDYVAVASRRPGLHVRQGRELAALADARRVVVLGLTPDRRRVSRASLHPQPLEGVAPRPEAGAPVVVWTGTLGRLGLAAGPRVHIVDRFGLADAIAARLRLPPRRPPRPGHEKSLPGEWVLARFAVPTTEARRRSLATNPNVRAARRALACPPLRELTAVTTAPLDAGRFIDNVGYAVRERSLRFAPEPPLAAQELCARR